jgi:hypothetical protein
MVDCGLATEWLFAGILISNFSCFFCEETMWYYRISPESASNNVQINKWRSDKNRAIDCLVKIRPSQQLEHHKKVQNLFDQRDVRMLLLKEFWQRVFNFIL